MEVKEIRRRNLAELVEQHGRNALATKVGTDPNYLSQIISQRTSAQCGDQLARRIEVALNKPRGWMDTDHEEQENLEQSIANALEAVLAAARLEGVEITPRQAARMVTVLLERHPKGTPSADLMSTYLHLIRSA